MPGGGNNYGRPSCYGPPMNIRNHPPMGGPRMPGPRMPMLQPVPRSMMSTRSHSPPQEPSPSGGGGGGMGRTGGIPKYPGLTQLFIGNIKSMTPDVCNKLKNS